MRNPLETAVEPWVLSGASLAISASKRDAPSESARFAIATPVASLTCKVLKRVVDEHRPRLFDKHAEQSFPSGHSASISAFAMTWVLSKRAWRALPIAVAAIAAVNILRVKKREHWLHDVIVGDAIGLAAAGVGELVAYLVARKRA